MSGKLQVYYSSTTSNREMHKKHELLRSVFQREKVKEDFTKWVPIDLDEFKAVKEEVFKKVCFGGREKKTTVFVVNGCVYFFFFSLKKKGKKQNSSSYRFLRSLFSPFQAPSRDLPILFLNGEYLANMKKIEELNESGEIHDYFDKLNLL